MDYKVADSIDRLTAVIEKAISQPTIMASPLEGMEVTSGVIGWSRVEAALEEIKIFDKMELDCSSRNNIVFEYKMLVERIKLLLMEHRP